MISPYFNKKPFGLSLSKAICATRTSTGSALTVLGMLTLWGAAPAYAETVAITGGKVIISDGSAPIEGGTVIIRDGNIVAAGKDVAVPTGARLIDASGKWVTPGIFAGFTRLGLSEVDAVDGTNDTVASASPFSAAIDVTPAINNEVSAVAVNRSAGVTRAVVAPNSAASMFAGQGAIMDLGADRDAITAPRAFQFVVFGEDGAREAGGSRAAAHTFFRNALAEAREYQLSQRPFAARPHDAILTRPDMIALMPVIEGGMKLVVHAESAVDIRSVIALRTEYPKLDIVLVGASEGWRVAGDIAAAKMPVIASALNDLPATFEMLGATQSNIGRMKDAGVKVAIGMINDRDAHQLRYTTQYAGNLVSLQKVPGATGLSWDEAFAAISSVPADIMGIGDRHGSLKTGRAADVVIWDGDPLELYAAATTVMIDGVEQPLGNRQDRLRDRYRNPVEGDLPKAYDR
jgi:imidazolonepropionase-like amidohydrolase